MTGVSYTLPPMHVAYCLRGPASHAKSMDTLTTAKCFILVQHAQTRVGGPGARLARVSSVESRRGSQKGCSPFLWSVIFAEAGVSAVVDVAVDEDEVRRSRCKQRRRRVRALTMTAVVREWQLLTLR